MKEFLPAVTALCIAMLMTESCSVKEDRRMCPCDLELDLHEAAAGNMYDAGLVVIMPENLMIQEKISFRDYSERHYCRKVPRGYNHVMTAAGVETVLCHGDSLYVHPGSEWGPVMLAREYADCNGDGCLLTMHFRKEYCTLHVSVKGVPLSGPSPYGCVVRAGCSGVRMLDGTPVSGSYEAGAGISCFPALGQVRLPRQKDSPVMLDLIEYGDAAGLRPGRCVCTYDLGGMMVDAGYDWGKPDLDDMYIDIDFANSQVEVEVKPWKPLDINVTI